MRIPGRLGLVGLVFLAVVSGCGYSGSHGAQLRSWASHNSYLADAKQVATDVSDIELAIRLNAAKKMRTVCGGLSSDAGTLYETLDAPDHTLTEELGRSMSSFFVAAEKCAVATSTTSPKVVESIGEINAGLAELVVADRRLARYGVSSKRLQRLTAR